MRKTILLLFFTSLGATSCVGTKYASTGYLTSKSKTEGHSSEKLQDNKGSADELEKIYQEEVNVFLETKEDEKPSENNSWDLADNIIETATTNLGVRYRTGGTTKAGFDCSGLVFTSFKKYDISLPRSSYDMAQYGYKVKDSEAQKGDLIFFITNGGRRINHVGIVTEILGDEIKFIHSSVKLGVIISSTKESYYKKNFVKIHRVL